MTTVVAALIQHNGRLLICQRRTGSFALQWEFPGGKVQTGESPADALARELVEELGVTAAIGRELYRTRHRYREHQDELELVFFSAELAPGSSGVALDAQPPRNPAFEQIRWAEPAALPQFDFLPADRELVALLSRGALRVG
jgi:8-oxo-dGTP diphosphatase